MSDTITATIGMSPERAREIVEKVRNGERIQVEIRADLHPEIAEKEAQNIERQLEKLQSRS
jgi:hypothetical protein